MLWLHFYSGVEYDPNSERIKAFFNNMIASGYPFIFAPFLHLTILMKAPFFMLLCRLCLLSMVLLIAGCRDAAEPEPSPVSEAETPAAADRAVGKANTAMGIYYDVLHGSAGPQRLSEARQQLEEARALQPQNTRITRDYIQVLLAMGELRRAVEVSEQMLREDESHLLSHAMMLDRYERFEAAKPYYEAYIGQLKARTDLENMSEERLGEGITLAIGLLLMEEEEQAYGLIAELQERHPGARIWGDYLHLQRREFSKQDYLRDIYPEIE